MNDVTASQFDPRPLPDSLTGQGLALLCWAAVVALGYAAWRRRRGNDVSNLVTVGAVWLAVRLTLLVVGLPRAGQPDDDWLTLALDLIGLIVLVWPFLTPPLPPRWADRLAGIGLSVVALVCGVSLWQWVRGTLGLPPTPYFSITWAHSTLVLAGLAAINLLHSRTRRRYWLLTAAGAFLVGSMGLLMPQMVRMGTSALSSALAAAAATLAAAWLNWLEHWPRQAALPNPKPQIPNYGPRITGHESRTTNHKSRITDYGPRLTVHGSRTTNHVRSDVVSTADHTSRLFTATDLAQLLESATTALAPLLAGEGLGEGSKLHRAALLLTDDELPADQGLVADVPDALDAPMSDVLPSASSDPAGLADLIRPPCSHRPLRLVARWPRTASQVYPMSDVFPSGSSDPAQTAQPLRLHSSPLRLRSGQALRLRSGQALLADALARGQAINATRGANQPYLASLEPILGPGLQAALILPLLPPTSQDDWDRQRGLLVVGYNGGPLDKRQLQLARILADQVAVVAHSIVLRARIGQLSRTLAHVACPPTEQVLAQVRERSQQLEEEVQQLRRLDQLKAQFIAQMSHELRTPLNSIIGFSGLMLKGIDGQLSDVQREDIQTILTSGKHLLKLIHDILDVSQIWAGKMDLTLSDVNLPHIVADALAIAAPLTGDKRVELKQALDLNLPTIRADRTRVRQVLLNLLTNAIRHTQRGQITVSASREGDHVVIRVADTGAGIPKEHLEGIFEESARTESPDRRKPDGLGLGLSISRQLVELHGGQMWVESEVGTGSTFYFSLPVRGPQPDLAGRKITRQQLETALAQWQQSAPTLAPD